ILNDVINVIYNDVITSRNNASIKNFGGGFRYKKVKSKHFPTVFKKIEINKKSDRKTEIFIFRPNRFLLYGCNSKTNHCKYFKFSQNYYATKLMENFLSINSSKNKMLI
ncbi:Uncharacterized protein FWK35_00017570, partial [Aphis craccivora]